MFFAEGFWTGLNLFIFVLCLALCPYQDVCLRFWVCLFGVVNLWTCALFSCVVRLSFASMFIFCVSFYIFLCCFPPCDFLLNFHLNNCSLFLIITFLPCVLSSNCRSHPDLGLPPCLFVLVKCLGEIFFWCAPYARNHSTLVVYYWPPLSILLHLETLKFPGFYLNLSQ